MAKRKTKADIVNAIAAEEARRGRKLQVPNMPKKPSILSKIAGVIRRRSARPSRSRTTILGRPLAGGHFGIHLTSRKYREQREAEGLPRFTDAEKAKWQEMSGDALEQFVYFGQYLPVHSSNVAAARYDIRRQEMVVWFHGGRKSKFGEFTRVSKYRYSTISEKDALDFAYYLSKGQFIWDRLRVRGTKYGHRKPYRRIS